MACSRYCYNGKQLCHSLGIFSTISWGLVMVPVQALEATTLTFIGHSWSIFRRMLGTRNPASGSWKQILNFKDIGTETPRAAARQLWSITKWALYPVFIALAIKIPLCFLMAFLGARSFAHSISGSDEVTLITEHMWQTID